MTDLVSRETSDLGVEFVPQDQPDESSDKPLDVSQLGGSPASLKLSAKTKRQKKVRDLYSEQPVLRTESKDDLAWLRAEISQEIRPKNFMEKMKVSDIVYHTWQIMRYRRIKTGILNNALGAGLRSILRQIQFPPSTLPFFCVPMEIAMAPQNMAYEWMFDPEVKRRVSSMLQESGIDESAIEAEAYRRVADDIEGIDRRLNDAEKGRDKALRSIAKYRKGFADKLRRSSDRVIAADEVGNIVIDREN